MTSTCRSASGWSHSSANPGTGHERSPARLAAALPGLDQARLRNHSRPVPRIIRSHASRNQGPGLCMVRVILDHEQYSLHHTVSASTLSYSSSDPKNRIIRTLFAHCNRVTNR